MLDCISPGSDDIVLPKTSSNVFSSTNVDYILRSLEKRYVILAGCVTDQCVESAVREACDRHYYVTLVTGEPSKQRSGMAVPCTSQFTIGAALALRAVTALSVDSWDV